MSVLTSLRRIIVGTDVTFQSTRNSFLGSLHLIQISVKYAKGSKQKDGLCTISNPSDDPGWGTVSLESRSHDFFYSSAVLQRLCAMKCRKDEKK